MLPHKWLEIYNKSTALPFENHLQLLIIINKTRSLEITTDVSAIRHVIFQANFGYAYLQCIKYFLLTNKFISVFSLQKSSFERAEQLSLSFSWRENLWKDEQIKLQTSTPETALSLSGIGLSKIIEVHTTTLLTKEVKSRLRQSLVINT